MHTNFILFQTQKLNPTYLYCVALVDHKSNCVTLLMPDANQNFICRSHERVRVVFEELNLQKGDVRWVRGRKPLTIISPSREMRSAYLNANNPHNLCISAYAFYSHTYIIFYAMYFGPLGFILFRQHTHGSWSADCFITKEICSYRKLKKILKSKHTNNSSY